MSNPKKPEQLSLGLPEEPSRRQKRKRQPSSVPAPVKIIRDRTIMRPPEAVVCGYCGAKGTVFEDVGKCARCGAILTREE